MVVVVSAVVWLGGQGLGSKADETVLPRREKDEKKKMKKRHKEKKGREKQG